MTSMDPNLLCTGYLTRVNYSYLFALMRACVGNYDEIDATLDCNFLVLILDISQRFGLLDNNKMLPKRNRKLTKRDFN